MIPTQTNRSTSKVLLLVIPIFLVLLTATGCGAVVDAAMSRSMKMFGKEYREQLVSRVESARESQGEAQESFQTAYEELTALTGAGGGELEDRYNALKSAYDRADGRAEDVRDRIDKVQRAADRLFSEWESDNAEITDAALRRVPDQQLAETKLKYERMLTAMQAAESKMDPVLEQFNNYVLVLKSSLNAQAIAGLEGTVAEINDDVASLIAEMQASMAEADEFIQAVQ